MIPCAEPGVDQSYGQGLNKRAESVPSAPGSERTKSTRRKEPTPSSNQPETAQRLRGAPPDHPSLTRMPQNTLSTNPSNGYTFCVCRYVPRIQSISGPEYKESQGKGSPRTPGY